MPGYQSYRSVERYILKNYFELYFVINSHNCCPIGTTLAISKSVKLGGRHVTVVNVASILGLFCAQQPKGWAYNTSKSAVVTASRCIGHGIKHIRMVRARSLLRPPLYTYYSTYSRVVIFILQLCLCPSVAATPILNGCTAEEIKEMKKKVGGLMTASQVGAAFDNLLLFGHSGDVMAVWKDCPPYFIPETGMALFIAYTTAAMMFRFTPASLTPTSVRPWPHMFLCFIVILLIWILFGQLTIWIGSSLLS